MSKGLKMEMQKKGKWKVEMDEMIQIREYAIIAYHHYMKENKMEKAKEAREMAEYIQCEIELSRL